MLVTSENESAKSKFKLEASSSRLQTELSMAADLSSSWQVLPHKAKRIWLLQIITKNITGLLLVTPLDFHSLIQVFLWKKFKFTPSSSSYLNMGMSQAACSTAKPRSLPRLTRHSAPTFFCCYSAIKSIWQSWTWQAAGSGLWSFSNLSKFDGLHLGMLECASLENKQAIKGSPVDCAACEFISLCLYSFLLSK